MTLLDYLIIAGYFVFSIGIAIYYSKRSGKDTNEFFLSGRNLPWYLAGLSMVATTFAADTPLAVTELVARNGISGNWVWWNFLFGGMLTVFFFARLWRRAGIMTEAEFAEIRYAGKPARFLRGFRAIYLGLFMNVIIMGWVNKAMISVLTGMFGIPESEVIFYVFGCMILVAVYSALSGLWGVVVTDAFQFFIAMFGCIVLAVLVVNSSQIGGMSGLEAKLGDRPFLLDFFPQISADVSTVTGIFSLSIVSFLAYIGLQWWASWYPGAEPGGGGYIAQRMMSAKNEKHSLYATLFFQVAHYAIRPWPWIITALATLVIYPELGADDKKMGYIYAMNDFLPAGLKGLMVAAFFAAYMSTIATQLNWGSSYVMNDLYRRFMKPAADEKHYVSVSRVFTLLLMVVSVVVTLFIDRISGAWEFILECGAGVGGVLILRWFWWRVNAWSEIAALVTPFIVYPVVKMMGIQFPESLFYIVGINTVVWVAVTYLTKPEPEEKLIGFYKRVYPGGRLWADYAKKSGLEEKKGVFGVMFVNWIAGVVFVYSMLFGTGYLLFSDFGRGFLYLSVGIFAFLVINRNLTRTGWEQLGS